MNTRRLKESEHIITFVQRRYKEISKRSKGVYTCTRLEHKVKDTTEGIEAELGEYGNEATNERDELGKKAVDEAEDTTDELGEDLAHCREDGAKLGQIAANDLQDGAEGVNHKLHTHHSVSSVIWT